ncbi:peptide deformylase [Wolbachia endosymbiont of Cruorifilaria tuberocauda]|uniref:peptide deformylase n=1 Tax=Wolbachia endosymbiont of Cruorifilaria tuberocauda TaxID=1812111 RepID=UPI00158B7C5B|nr:peptide deformylase [Wolbachia endosymbiont of Cruorifilaria tuberocauda]QKX01895.1 peptide deformylase [Wolbachia endosymbiont of Cruorifilaria tuberocauda]
MSKLKILIFPHEKLTTRASQVDDINDKIIELVNDMFETMYNAEGFGLAAVQVGVLKRVFVMDVYLEDIESRSAGHESIGKFCMINPEIMELSDEQIILKEGCLSIPEQNYEIKRPKYLTVKYKNLNNEVKTLKACGWLARCIQHEIDHLNGILYIKHLSRLKHNMAMRKAQKVKRRYE